MSEMYIVIICEGFPFSVGSEYTVDAHGATTVIQNAWKKSLLRVISQTYG